VLQVAVIDSTVRQYAVNATEMLIPLSKVGRQLRSLTPLHITTVMRWALRGVGTPPVKLATVKVGGRRYTTAEAIEAFVRATSTPTGGMAPETATTTRAAAARRAEEELDADGIG
jgi:hypothetical protein